MAVKVLIAQGKGCVACCLLLQLQAHALHGTLRRLPGHTVTGRLPGCGRCCAELAAQGGMQLELPEATMRDLQQVLDLARCLPGCIA